MIPPEIQQRILGAITQRAPAIQICPVCHVGRWTLLEGLIKLPIITEPKQFPNVVLGGASVPLVALTCNHCGNTLLMNLMVLGLGDLVASPQPNSESNSPDARQDQK